MVLWQALKRYDPARGSLPYYLHWIARNEVWTSCKSEGRQHQIVERIKQDPTVLVIYEMPQKTKHIYRYRYVDYKGQTQTLGAWARELGVSVSTLRRRIDSGMSFSDAISSITK